VRFLDRETRLRAGTSGFDSRQRQW
jgi:hypothetical protein